MIYLEPDEKILIEVHKHWIVYVSEAIVLGLLVLVPFLAASLFDLPSFLVPAGEKIFLFLFLTGLWLLALWVIFFLIWTFHYLDVWVITNKRLVDIEQIGLFSRDVSSFRFEKIQDITVEVHGILATTLGYGTVHVQTAGEGRELSLTFVPHPERVRQLVNQLQDKSMNHTSTQSPLGP